MNKCIGVGNGVASDRYIKFIDAANEIASARENLLDSLLVNEIQVFLDLGQRILDNSYGFFQVSVVPVMDGLHTLTKIGAETVKKERCRGLPRFWNEDNIEYNPYEEIAVGNYGVDYDTHKDLFPFINEDGQRSGFSADSIMRTISPILNCDTKNIMRWLNNG